MAPTISATEFAPRRLISTGSGPILTIEVSMPLTASTATTLMLRGGLNPMGKFAAQIEKFGREIEKFFVTNGGVLVRR